MASTFGLRCCSPTRALVPLHAVHVEVVVARAVALHRLTQTYVNDGPAALETEYLFPLPEGMGVVEFSATFSDGRKIVGVIKEKEEAKSAYRQAVQAGERAALLEEYRPDVFQASVGNLEAGEAVAVCLAFCGELVVEQDALRMTIPAHVAPRYAPLGRSNGAVARLQGSSQEASAKALFSADLSWESGAPVEHLESPTHPEMIVHAAVEAEGASLKLEGGGLEADLVLSLVLRDLFQPSLLWEAWEERHSQALMLSLVPKFEVPRLRKAEVIFIVDCSGSMQGARLEQSKRALHICTQALPEDATFNIVKFGSRFTALSLGGSLPRGDERSLASATAFINAMRADLGGTEILPPLQFGLDSQAQGATSKQLILLTDGQVHNEQALIDAVRGRGSRIFTLGIGSGVSTFLVKGLARATNGHAAFVQDREPLEEVCASMLRKALTPAITDVKIAWPCPVRVEDDFVVIEPSAEAGETGADDQADTKDDSKTLSFFDPNQKDPKAYGPPETAAERVLRSKELQQAPQRPTAIFADSHFCAFALLPRDTIPDGDVELSAESPVGKICLRLKLPRAPTRRAKPLLHCMAARALIRDIEQGDAVVGFNSPQEAIRLSLDFGVLCQSTAFVAIDQRNGRYTSLVPDPMAGALGASVPASSPAHLQVAAHRLRRETMRPPMAVTNSISWRCEGIIYKKNELFLDILETLNYVVGVDGALISSQVMGVLRMKCLLSGMPEVKVALNNRLQWGQPEPRSGSSSSLRWHQCVRLARWEMEKVLSFIPPDGEFELLSYELPATRLPLQLRTAVRPASEEGRTEYVISLEAAFKASRAEHVNLCVPLPAGCHDAHAAATHGTASWDGDDSCIRWRFDSLPSGRECELVVTFAAPAVRVLPPLGTEPPVVAVQLRLAGCSAAGMEVPYLKVTEKSGYEVSKHLRYLTTAAECRHRLPG